MNIPNSSFFDLVSLPLAPQSVDKPAATILGLSNVQPVQNGDLPENLQNGMILAFFLERGTPPTGVPSIDELLNLPWGERYKLLQQIDVDDAYGADPQVYQQVQDYIASLRTEVVQPVAESSPEVQNLTTPEGSAANRTLFIHIPPESLVETFQQLFGVQLLVGTDSSGNAITFYEGNLDIPQEIAEAISSVNGLRDYLGSLPEELVDTNDFVQYSQEVALQDGDQSPGNQLTRKGQSPDYDPSKIAALYNFPILDKSAGENEIIALAQPAIGIGPVEPFLRDFGGPKYGLNSNNVYVQANNNDLDEEDKDTLGELYLDTAVVANTTPAAEFQFYGANVSFVDSENRTVPGESPDTTQSYWSAVYNDQRPTVFSSSYGLLVFDSFFANSFYPLAEDAAVRGITMLDANGDQGSGSGYFNGITNVYPIDSSPYVLGVGGTSLSTFNSVVSDGMVLDSTLESLYENYRQKDPATLLQLGSVGLNNQVFTETVWNQGYFKRSKKELSPGYRGNFITGGGVNTNLPVPLYQQEFGLSPTTVNPDGGTGRGVLDVAALAGGNLYYSLPDDQASAGTSAASPLWASLVANFNQITTSLGLPRVGYFHDLLYQSALLNPAAFNDVALGNNNTSFKYGGDISDINGNDKQKITPTGLGYEAGPGYDLTSGLGSPNGTVLADTLVQIMTNALSEDPLPKLFASGRWGSMSSVHQVAQPERVVFQPTALQPDFEVGYAKADSPSEPNLQNFQSLTTAAVAEPYGVTASIANRALQSDSAGNPLLLKPVLQATERQAQSLPVAATFSPSDQYVLAVRNPDGTISGADFASPNPDTLLSSQGFNYTNPFGFTQYNMSGNQLSFTAALPALEVQRAPALQESELAQVTLRRVSTSISKFGLFEVDDLTGSINGVTPEQAGYSRAAMERLYTNAETGEALVSGPKYYELKTVDYSDVSSGDLLGMMIQNSGGTFFSFDQANPDKLVHTMRYGATTFGFEDLLGGGDLDYQDLLVGFNFNVFAGNSLV